MSFSPVLGGRENNSPDRTFPDIRCNLESQFLQQSTKSDCNMCVYARVRPLLDKETEQGFKECLAAIDETTIRVVVPVTSAKYKNSRQTDEIIEEYTFTAAFGPEAGQFVFFQETMLNSIENFVAGGNSLVFSYGITGSGKTFTLQGNSENPGIIPISLRLYFAAMEKQLTKEIKVKPSMYNDVVPLTEAEKQKEMYLRKQLLSLYDEECETVPGSFRNNKSKSFAMTLCDLFSDDFEMEARQTTLSAEDMASAQAATQLKEVIQACAAKQHGVCSIWISFIEIYNENIFDLLQPVTNHRSRLNLGEDKNGNVYVKGAQEMCVFSYDEALKILNIGRKHLSIASTKMNYQSSRSHCIYTIRVVRIPDSTNLSHARVNRLSFCDLAGSERASKTQASGVRLKEANAINTSLLVLGRCLEQLRLIQMGKDRRMIPFRESKLTRIFSGFFLGQGKAVMVANASPSDYTFDETMHVLKFSALAKKIMVNDTFLSSASSTIQSICSQWGAYQGNSSMYNESMESVESDTDVTQQKDELIEKLLEMAENFSKREKEMANLEMRIRQEVCDEYSEYSDQLLEAKRLMYEEQMEALKESYKKRIASMEKMYDGIIKGYKEQLSESEGDDSFNQDKTVDLSKSIEGLNDSSLSPTVVSGLSSAKAESRNTSEKCQSCQEILLKSNEESKKLKQDIEELEKELSSARTELSTSKKLIDQSKEDLEKVHKLESENNVFKDKIEILQKEINELISCKSSYEEEIKACKSKLSDTEKQLKDKEEEVATEKKKAVLPVQMQKENEELTNKLKVLEKEILELKEAKMTSEKDIQKFQNIICNLEKELSASHQENTKFKEKNQDSELETRKLSEKLKMLEKEILESKKAKLTIEEDIKKYKNDICNLQKKLSASQQENQTAELTDKLKMLEKEILEQKELSSGYEKDIQEYKKEICTLKDQLTRSQQESSKEEQIIKEKCDTIAVLENEISKYKKELTDAKKAVKEHANYQILYNSDIEKQKSKISSLEEELKLRELLSTATVKEIDELKQKNLQLTKDNESLVLKKIKVEEELKSKEREFELMPTVVKDQKEAYEKEIAEWKLDFESSESSKKTVEEKLALANEEIEKMKKEIQLKSSQLTKLENLKELYETEREKWKQEEETLINSKKKLEETLDLVQNKQKSVEKEFQQKSSELAELEKYKNNSELDITTLKKEKETLLSEKNQLQTKFTTMQQELKNLKDDLSQKSSKSDLETKIESLIKEKENVLLEKTELQEKLLSAEKELKSCKDTIQQKTTKLVELEKLCNKHEVDIDKLLLEKANSLSLEEKVSTLNKELENAKCRFEEKASSVAHLKHEISECQQDLAKQKEIIKLSEDEKGNLKKNISAKEKKIQDLEEEIAAVNDELKTARDKISEKVSIVEKSQNSILEYKRQIEKLSEELKLKEREKIDLLSTVSDKEKYIEQLKAAEKDSIEKSSMENLENKYSEDLRLLKESLQLIKKEKEELLSVISNHEKNIRDLEEKLSAVSNELKIVKSDIVEKNSVIKDLKNNLTKSKKLLEEKTAEQETRLNELSKIKQEYDDLEQKHTELNQKIQESESKKEELEKDLISIKQTLADLHLMVDILQMCECKATSNNYNLDSKLNIQKAEIKNLHLQICNKENSVEELEQGLTHAQDQIKELRTSFDNKIAAEKEQHMIEIEATMKLKHEVEEENEKLKEENIKLKENSKALEPENSNAESKKKVLSKTGNVTSKIQNLRNVSKEKGPISKNASITAKAESVKTVTKEKENLSKNLSTRMLRQKQMKIKDLSFSSVDSTEEAVEEESSKRRKKVSDADFITVEERTSKKMASSTNLRVPTRSRKRVSDEDVNVTEQLPKKLKPMEESKIPVTRVSRRKLISDQTENLSPVQKIATSISTRFKGMAESVSNRLASPRITRGRKKLFNPDSAAPTTKSEKTKGKK